jgi:hypothetical protein
MNHHDYAEMELSRFFKSDDEMDQLMKRQILEIVDLFGTHGHSGFSAPYAIGILEKLLRYEPLSPLTGEDSEWFKHDGGLEQNMRAFNVFRENGKAYQSDYYVFRDPDGSCWTNGESRKEIEFPYTPGREYVDRAAEVEEAK